LLRFARNDKKTLAMTERQFLWSLRGLRSPPVADGNLNTLNGQFESIRKTSYNIIDKQRKKLEKSSLIQIFAFLQIVLHVILYSIFQRSQFFLVPGLLQFRYVGLGEVLILIAD